MTEPTPGELHVALQALLRDLDGVRRQLDEVREGLEDLRRWRSNVLGRVAVTAVLGTIFIAVVTALLTDVVRSVV